MGARLDQSKSLGRKSPEEVFESAMDSGNKSSGENVVFPAEERAVLPLLMLPLPPEWDDGDMPSDVSPLADRE